MVQTRTVVEISSQSLEPLVACVTGRPRTDQQRRFGHAAAGCILRRTELVVRQGFGIAQAIAGITAQGGREAFLIGDFQVRLRAAQSGTQCAVVFRVDQLHAQGFGDQIAFPPGDHRPPGRPALLLRFERVGQHLLPEIARLTRGLQGFCRLFRYDLTVFFH